jgi:uncharacterized cupredoxin-like copper-binding protein
MSKLAWFVLLIGLIGPAASAQAPAGEQTVTVQLSDFKFTPSQLSLQAGRPYRLQLQNTASHGHSFSSPDFFAAANVASQDQAKIQHGTIDVPGGQNVDIEVTPQRAGQYRFHCTHFMHSAFGMTGAITVQ